MLNATLEIESECAETILQSLKPETGRDLPRSKVSLSGNGKKAVVNITANDVSAMRAALNSCLGCIKVTEEISKVVKVKK